MSSQLKNIPAGIPAELSPRLIVVRIRDTCNLPPAKFHVRPELLPKYVRHVAPFDESLRRAAEIVRPSSYTGARTSNRSEPEIHFDIRTFAYVAPGPGHVQFTIGFEGDLFLARASSEQELR